MSNHRGTPRRRYLKLSLVLAALGAGYLLAASSGMAQTVDFRQLSDKDRKALIGDGDQMPNVHWFKLCETIQSVNNGVATNIDVCRVHHRALDATTGNPLASVTITKVKGREEESVSIIVPLGTAIKAGIRVKIDEDAKAMALEYASCSPLGCQGETILTPEILDKMKKGKLMFIAVVGANDGKALGIPVPLAGFAKAYDGDPIDNKKFAQVQNARQLAILERRAELQKRAGQAKAAPAPAPAPAAPAPAAAPVKPKRLE